jgi:hypothetical protein
MRKEIGTRRWRNARKISRKKLSVLTGVGRFTEHGSFEEVAAQYNERPSSGKALPVPDGH